ncbi:type I polyketide synthase [Azospirillum thermophilum]|uniref:Phenolphthiocerol/phthiocerol polyketide synthase subunit E n=1 Tax=Azospirillum thermophilum TaxID=2202148 RepID=A0A2S2CUX8_9PROT|nr:type I polyketide synthase [Azospirillum thermophilum]AWK88323.1 polyketide synthase [Azospirillum thermophilum]
MEHRDLPPGAVAVVGLACRLPGADSPDAFWRLLRSGGEAITRFTAGELEAAGFDPAVTGQPGFVAAKGVLAEADGFDAGFFGFSPREAALMDPQHRVFLECAWMALEDAGYDPKGHPGAIGVFAGSILSTYLLRHLWPNRSLVETAGTFQLAVGNDPTFLATRAAYLLDLKGPAVSVGTACSTSLVAVHLACQSLLSHECDMALAGGVSIHLPLVSGYRYEDGGILSPDGHCRPFDAAARGTVSSDGAGVVTLKRLEDAVADGDVIHAVIRGSAINNDGSDKVGYTAPGVAGQARVIAEALAMAGVEPDTLALLEAHAAGTRLGDPIEVAALAEAFAGCATPASCAIGSVKSNIGHVDAAAGVAGLIKAVLALRHRAIPPSLHFTAPNPQLGLERTPFYVPTALVPYDRAEPMRAGVSSFGIGGTNAHVVLEEPPALPRAAPPPRPFELLLLSARSPAALDAACDRLADRLEGDPALPLGDVAHTLRRGRRGFEHRRILVAGTAAEAAALLRARDPQRCPAGAAPAERPGVAFLFPGLGDHYAGMGWELYCAEPQFRRTVDECAEILRDHQDGDIRDFLFAGRDWRNPVAGPAAPLSAEGGKIDLRAMLARRRPPAATDAPANAQADAQSGARIDAQAADLPRQGQPGIFVVEYALAQLLRSWGVEPDSLIGYSIGEFVAACVAGVVELADALAVVSARARLIESRVARGAMLAVPLPEEELRPRLPAGVSVGAVNGPRLTVLSGEETGIAALESALAAEGVSCQRLRSTHAYHSAMLEVIVADLRAVLARVTLRPPRIPYVSCVTGRWITDDEATDPGYWAQHLCRTVRFRDGLASLLDDPRRILLEVGPGQSLTSHAMAERARLRDRRNPIIPAMRWAYAEQSELAVLLRAVGQLWLAGAPMDPARLLVRGGERRVPLPTYPFERRRHWIEPPAAGREEDGPARRRARVEEWFYLPYWKPAVALPAPAQEVAAGTVEDWLVLRDGFGAGDVLASRLAMQGVRVTTVSPGDAFAWTGEAATLDPRREEEYRALARSLREAGRLPARIVHLWSLTGTDGALPDGGRFRQAQEVGFYSLMRLFRALWTEDPEGTVRLDLVTDGLFDVTGGEPLAAEKATLLAPILVAPQERPGVVCRCIDLDGLPADRGALADRLMTELMAKPAGPAVALRRGRRWVQDYEPVALPPPARTPLRERGVYLLTGGLGGVGLVLARHLAKTVQARLVLVGRTPLPDRAEWPRLLADPARDGRAASRVRQVLELESLGAEVLVVAADVADRTAMAHALALAEDRFGPLHGVIHGAGAVGVEAFREITRAGTADCEAQFRAKVHGLLVLDDLLAGRPLDFCVLMSSLAAVLGGLGFAAYSAGNLFLDAFARRRSRDGGLRWTSIDWDSWKLADVRPSIAGLGATVNAFTMEPEEGADALDRILMQGDLGQVVVSSGDLHGRLRQWVARDDAGKTDGDPAPLHQRPELRSGYAEPRSDLERTLAAIWTELFTIAPIGIHDNFFELGGHSLLATQLNARISSRLHVELSLATLLQAPTIAELATAIVGAQAAEADPDALAAMLDELGGLSPEELDRLLAEEAQSPPTESPPTESTPAESTHTEPEAMAAEHE